ncbi:hypothetical protein [Peribacillus butanolivorans]|uniref:hypothetical protein n=1 Tax=Peribacillus butanolivorans TaxID=421767 RepID=UPI0035DB4BB0
MEWIYKYFSLTAVIAGLGFLIKYLIQKKIDSYFNTKLEDHKKELAVMTEKAKYDISRKLFDFEVYAIKKHTIYPELYQLVFEVPRKMSVLSYLKEVTLSESFKEVEDAISNLLNYFNKNELFLSKDVASTFLVTFDLILDLHGYFHMGRENRNFILEEVHKLRKEIEILKEVMYEELSYSHFEETKEKV